MACTTTNVMVFYKAAGRGLAPAAMHLIAGIAKEESQRGILALQMLAPFGDAALPLLAEILEASKTRIHKHQVLATIASLESEAARDLLESLDFSDSREFWRAKRQHLRRLDLALAKN